MSHSTWYREYYIKSESRSLIISPISVTSVLWSRPDIYFPGWTRERQPHKSRQKMSRRQSAGCGMRPRDIYRFPCVLCGGRERCVAIYLGCLAVNASQYHLWSSSIVTVGWINVELIGTPDCIGPTWLARWLRDVKKRAAFLSQKTYNLMWYFIKNEIKSLFIANWSNKFEILY